MDTPAALFLQDQHGSLVPLDPLLAFWLKKTFLTVELRSGMFLFCAVNFFTWYIKVRRHPACKGEKQRVETFLILAVFGIIFVRYGNWFSRLEQVENAPKFPRPSEGVNQFANGFRNLTNQLKFSGCSWLLAILVLERKVIPNPASLRKSCKICCNTSHVHDSHVYILERMFKCCMVCIF